MGGQPGFFDLDERYAALSAAGDPLVRLGELVDFEVFRQVNSGRPDSQRTAPYEQPRLTKKHRRNWVVGGPRLTASGTRGTGCGCCASVKGGILGWRKR